MKNLSKEIADLEEQIEFLDHLKDKLEDRLAEKIGKLMFLENNKTA